MDRDDKVMLYKIILRDIVNDLQGRMDNFYMCQQEKIKNCIFSLGFIEDLYTSELSGYLRGYIQNKEDSK